MKARKLILLILVFLYFSADSILPWGFFAHKRVNKYAVFTLPEEIKTDHKITEKDARGHQH